MAQAWQSVQEASYGKKKMEASDTQMGTITVKTDAEREARAKAYRDKKKAETNEAMDPVNPKELKGKHKDRKDKDINNDGKVNSTDKYLHARRKAVSKAMKKDQEVEVQTSEATVNELSKKTLGSYIKKASDDKADNAYNLGAKDPLGKKGSWSKSFKRRKGIATATDKLTREEVELDEGIEKMSHARLKWHMNTGVPHGSYTKDEMKAERDRRLSKVDTHAAYKKAKPSMNEAATATHKPNNGSPAGEGLSPSAKKELARKTPMPDIVNEPVIDKKTFDAIRASGKKAPMRNNDNAQGDKTPPKSK
jgi:hypothetical protein